MSRRTIGPRWPKDAEFRDHIDQCDYCMTPMRRSLLVRDGDGLLRCPDEGEGLSRTEAEEANAMAAEAMDASAVPAEAGRFDKEPFTVVPLATTLGRTF